MKNFEKLHQAGLFPSNVANEGDLSQDARQAISNLTPEEVDSLISAFNKVDQGKKTEIQNLMPVCGF